MNNLDVLIVGGGAAGGAAAFYLAKEGLNVVLLEKSERKIIKPCGGGMASSVQSLFPFELTSVVDEIISEVHFSWCLEDQVIAKLPGSSPFWIVRREKLDDLITEQAIKKGVDYLNPFKVIEIEKEGENWRVTSEKGEILFSKVVIIADGSNSPWPIKYGLGPKKQHHAITTSVRLEGRGNIPKGATKFEFGLVHHGFSWAFPIKNGVNIGIGTFVGKHSSNSDEILNKLLPYLGFEPKDGERTESFLRVWNGHHQLHGDGIIAIGDAASLCDPFLAEGLRPALISGVEAAKSVKDLFSGNRKDLSSYTESMRLKWGESMAWGRRIAQVFYRFPKVGYQLGIKRPTAPQRIAEILSGEMGYGEIAQRVIKRLLFKSN